MKKNLYVSILTIVTIVLIFVGLVWHVAPFAGITLPWVSSQQETANSKTVTKDWGETELGECRGISLALDAGDVTLQTGSHCSVHYEGIEQSIPQVQSEEGRWTIHQKMGQKHVVNLNSFRENRIVVTVPEGMNPESVDFNVDAGDLKISGITVDQMAVDADAGDIELKNCRIGTLKMDVDAGDLDITDTGFTGGSLDLDAGDIKMHNVTFTDLTGELDMGNMEIDSAVPLEDAEMDLKVSLGDIKINGTNQSKPFHQSGTSGIRLDFSADLGDIRINW